MSTEARMQRIEQSLRRWRVCALVLATLCVFAFGIGAATKPPPTTQSADSFHIASLVVDSLYITKSLELDNADGKALVEITKDGGDNGQLKLYGRRKGKDGKPDEILPTAEIGGGFIGNIDFGSSLTLYGDSASAEKKTYWTMDSSKMIWVRNGVEQWHDPQ